MSSIFAKPVDNFRTTTSGRSVGATSLPLATGASTALGSLAGNRIFRITAVDTSSLDTEDEVILTVLEATGITGDTLTGITPAIGYNDVALPNGTTIDIRVCAEDISELQDAINLLETSGASGGITALTGDVIANGPGSANATLKTVNSNVGSFTLASIAVDAQGRVRAASNGTGGGGGAVNSFLGFGAVGPVTTGQKPATHYVDVTMTAYGLVITASAGTVTAQIEKSTNSGSSWTAVDNVVLSSGLSNTKTISAALTPGTLLRVNYTAVSGCSDPVVRLLVSHT